jgi:NAD(P)-dependent dehydrogenase (short-subunit alcohol dehydrogenase family)/pimeloyl-ACP methyl ester carboxylesterase
VSAVARNAAPLSRVTETRVRSGEVELAVRTWGAPNGRPPLVLVHGYPDTQATWEPVIARLAGERFIITYDVRGAGSSSAPAKTSGYALPRLVDDLLAVLDAVVPKQAVHLVGHDWGSIQSWEAVTAPELRARFLSFTSIAGPCLDHAGHWVREHSLREVGEQFAKSWYITLFQLPGAQRLWELIGPRWNAISQRVEGVPATTGDRTLDGARGVGLYRANFIPRLARPRQRTTEVPVQLLVPTRDHYESPRLADDTARWAPHTVRRDVFAGHWLHVSHPEVVARAIATFATDIDAGRIPRRAKSGPLAGKLAVVTGAGSGIGRATAFDLVEHGATVVAADVDLAAATVTAELGTLLGGTVHAERVDVADPRAMTEFAERVARLHGVPDIVINNAGIGAAGRFLATSAEEWDRVLAINLGGVVTGCRLFAQQMVAQARPGHIINVSSAAAFAPSKLLSAYATSKAAVLMLSECLRADLAPHGIRVGALCPGFIATAITTTTRFSGDDTEREQRRRRTVDRLYRRRGLTGDDAARAIIDAILHDRPLTLVGSEAHALRWLQRGSPRLARLLARLELPGGR